MAMRFSIRRQSNDFDRQDLILVPILCPSCDQSCFIQLLPKVQNATAYRDPVVVKKPGVPHQQLTLNCPNANKFRWYFSGENENWKTFVLWGRL